MALLLVRHAKNLPKDKDPAKGLSEEGISEVEHIAGLAKKIWGQCFPYHA
jgi:phosphohistidine phosphatase SixA